MQYNLKIIISFLILSMVVYGVQGVPTTADVSGITANQVTFSATGTGSDGWFEWGQFSGGYYHWTTLNQTYSGSFTDTQLGTPMLTSQTYYVRACDDTGCGNEVTWTVPSSNLPNRTTFGAGMMQVLRSGFNTSVIIPAILAPYTDVTPGGAPVVWGLLFFFIFAGYWLRSKDIFIPMLLAMALGGTIWMGTSAVGVAPEFAHIGQGLLIAAMAGAFVSWFSK